MLHSFSAVTALRQPPLDRAHAQQRLPRSDRFRCLMLAQSVHDAAAQGEAEMRRREEKMLEELKATPKLEAYALAVLRSLRRGAVLQGIEVSI